MTIGGIVTAVWIVLTLGMNTPAPVVPVQHCTARIGSACVNTHPTLLGLRLTW